MHAALRIGDVGDIAGIVRPIAADSIAQTLLHHGACAHRAHTGGACHGSQCCQLVRFQQHMQRRARSAKRAQARLALHCGRVAWKYCTPTLSHNVERKVPQCRPRSSAPPQRKPHRWLLASEDSHVSRGDLRSAGHEVGKVQRRHLQ